jgi:3'(2'), 5'-bisphosphate nucleotidase
MSSYAHDYLDAVTAIAIEAGAAILNIYRDPNTNWEVDRKADDSPLTLADLASHQVIDAALCKLTPDIPVLSEEGADIPWEERKNWSRFWLVDPLDGTKEFLKRNDEFTVNIALIEDGLPVLGVVYAPALKERDTDSVGTTWRAANGQAQRSVNGTGWRDITVTPHQPGDTWQVVASRSHPSPELADYLASLGDHACQSMGSSLKMCLVAEGSAHVYPRFGPTMQWDTGAAEAVLRAAGGTWQWLDEAVTSYDREALLNPGFIAAAQ